MGKSVQNALHVLLVSITVLIYVYALWLFYATTEAHWLHFSVGGFDSSGFDSISSNLRKELAMSSMLDLSCSNIFSFWVKQESTSQQERLWFVFSKSSTCSPPKYSWPAYYSVHYPLLIVLLTYSRDNLSPLRP